MSSKFRKFPIKPKRPVGGSNFRFPPSITNPSNINTRKVTPVTNQRQVNVANNKGQKINYPPFSMRENKFGDEVSRYINSNEGILSLKNRNKQIADALNVSHPFLTTRTGKPITSNAVGKTITGSLGYPKLTKSFITDNPLAVDKVKELVTSNTSIKSPAIIKELIKIDKNYKELTPQSITDYLNRNFPNIRTTKSTTEQNAVRNKKAKIQAELDDLMGNSYGKISSTGIANLRDKVAPIFKKITAEPKGNILEGLHPALLANRTKPEAKVTISTPYRNSRHYKLENEVKKLMEQKNSIISNLDSNNMHLLSDVNNKISNLNNQMSLLGLSSKLNNPRLAGDEYFGSIYPNLNTLYKSVKGQKGGIGPNVTGKDIPGFNMGGLISMLSKNELQGMAKSLSPKQVKMLTRQGPR